MNQCKFIKAWIGPCKNEADESGFCTEHKNIKCSSCGEQATEECYQTMGSFVCGSPICNKCEHELAEDGTNGWNCKHCKKGEQKYTPWYMRQETE